MSGKTGKIRFGASFLFVTSLAAAVLVSAVEEFRVTTRFFDVTQVAQALERGSAIPVRSLKRLAQEIDDGTSDLSCRSDIVRSVTTVLLTDLDQQNVDLAYDEWSISLERTHRFLERAVRCLPTDGNGWLRLAMVERAIGSPLDRTTQLLTLSQHFAPAEESVISARLQVWNRMSSVELSAVKPLVLADIQTFRLYSAPGRIVDLPVASNAIRALIPQAMGVTLAPTLPRSARHAPLPSS